MAKAEGLDELHRTIARFEEAKDDLDAKIREAHAATKDARQAQRDLLALIERTLPGKAQAAVDDVLAVEVKKALDTVLVGMRATEERITKRFDTIAGILMGDDPKQRRQGKPSLEEMVQEVSRRG